MSKKGYIFLCNDITEPECLELSLFGGKNKYVSRVRGLEIGDRLFLYNYNSKKLHGIFEATTEVIENIVLNAWNGEFPWQVKVKRVKDCKTVSREDIQADKNLREFIKFDRAGRPSARLAAETTEHLEILFDSDERVRVYDDETRYVTDDGHKVRSKPELKIDNWLYENRVVHAYETMIPEAKRCDFEIPCGNGSVYIEYWGLKGARYLKDKEAKREIYRKHNLELIELEQKDLKNLDKILRTKLLPRI